MRLVFEDIYHTGRTDCTGVMLLTAAGGVEVGLVQHHTCASIRQGEHLDNTAFEFHFFRVVLI